MPIKKIRIATRKSPLALWQAEHVSHILIQAHPGLEVELIRMVTQGDKILDTPLAKVGGKGLFVKELEQGLLEDQADIAVHSMKDVPVELPDGLHLAVILSREEPRDAFVSNNFNQFNELPRGARLGTSSLRRQCQLAALRPDLRITDLRGNVGTRLGKLDAGEFDAIILASAGLIRLAMANRIAERLDINTCLPAIGQGAIGIECRIDDPLVNELISVLNDTPTQICVTAERAMNHRLEGGCQVPIAGYATLEGDTVHLRGLVGQPDGSKIIQGEIKGEIKDARQMGIALADDLLSRGAGSILQKVYGG